MDGMSDRSNISLEAEPILHASFGDIPGSLCSPVDDWPRPFRFLSHDNAWECLAEVSNLHSVQFDPSGRWRADALNFQPCAETPSQDRYAIQQINIQGRIWTLSAVFDGHLGSHTVEHVACHMPIIVREHLEVITQKHGDRVVPPPLIADMFAMAIRAFDDAIAKDVLELFPGGLSSLSDLSDLQIQEVLDDRLSGGHNYTKARLCMYGTTALVALVDPDHKNLWLANLGDCQGLMVSDTDRKEHNIEVLTRFHNGENPLEVERVMNEHPGESECILDGRVLGAIAPFRCLGDTPFKQPPEFTRRILYNLYPGQHDTTPWEEFLVKNHTPPYISSTPEVTHYPLDPSPEAPRKYLILCSDGFTDICGTRQRPIIDQWARAASCSSSREPDEKSLALRLLWQALGNDPMSVSRVLTLNMDSPWLDDYRPHMESVVVENMTNVVCAYKHCALTLSGKHAHSLRRLMAKPLPSSASTDYSDLFGPDDPEFLEALGNAVLPGDVPLDAESESPSRKRLCDESDEPEVEMTTHGNLTNGLGGTEVDLEIYGASRFGHLGEYMHRKRAKLQIQNAHLDASKDVDGKHKIFNGLSIYINGWTHPSVQDLRQLIVTHGGVFQPYLDKKSLVTHIITCSLTPAKIKDWKHMKIVRPEWLVDSAAAGTLLPWRNYIFKPGGRVHRSQGADTPQSYLSSDSHTTLHNREQPLSGDHIPAAPDSGTAGATTAKSSDSASPASLLPRPLHVTDPGTHKDTARVPGYAAHTSNLLAERVMANPEWRAAHTSVAPDFIEGFYKNSRLHYLSTWKAELKKLVQQAQDEVENGESLSAMDDFQDVVNGSNINMEGTRLVMGSPSRRKGKEKTLGLKRVIMHCDFDCFFVSVGLLSHPELRGKPVVVCHSQGGTGGVSSTSEIASSSYEARSFGIKNGMSLQQGRRLCPDLTTIPYEFEKYKELSLRFYKILMRHADDIQAVSVDEALIEVTTSVARCALRPSSLAFTDDPAKSLAEQIRSEVRNATDCEVSIGIAENMQLARVATRKAKPAGSFHLKSEDVRDVLAPLDIDDLHGFGHSTRQKAREKLGATNIGELAKKSKAALCDALGKTTGETLYNAIRGIDERKLESDKPRKSVSCDINYGIRFENSEQAKAFIYQMAEEVSRRLNAINMCGRSLTLKIMKRDPSAPVEAPKFMGHGICETFNKQAPLSSANGKATSNPKDIGDHAWKLLNFWGFDPKELRGIGIQIQKLDTTSASDTTDSGQVKLPFQARTSTTTVQANTRQDELPKIVTEPPSQDDPPRNGASTSHPFPAVDLPAFSQVDKDVFDALPDDVRKELELEYQRRSHTPMPPEKPSHNDRPKIVVKGVNVKKTNQQLAPKNRPMVPARKNVSFANRPGPLRVQVSEGELRRLDIDPEVFMALPVDLQREQLITARHLKNGGVIQERKIIKAFSRRRRVSYPKKPPPLAKHPQLPRLKQQGEQPGEKLYIADTADVQTVIELWVKEFTDFPPNQKDVEYFSKFLVGNVETADTGVERTIAAMKWWLVLLRRNWGAYERMSSMEEEDGCPTIESIGRAWWKAFEEVKVKIDIAARRRFGASLVPEAKKSWIW